MTAERRVFWSATATAQFLELEETTMGQVDYCVDLIKQFPMIGNRLMIDPDEHRRRFVCAGFRIVYDIKETRFVEVKQKLTEPDTPGPPQHIEITIRRLSHT